MRRPRGLVFPLNTRRRAQLRDASARQRSTVVSLSRRLLERVAPSALLEAAAAGVAQAFDLTHVAILEAQAEGTVLLLRAARGWQPQALRGVTKNDLDAVGRASFLAERGLVSGISALIPGRERPFGLLSAHTTMRRTFTAEDVDFLRTVANLLGSALQRAELETRLASQRQDYRTLFESNLDAVLLTGGNGRILAANPAACRLVARTEAELQTLGWNDLVDPSDPRGAVAADACKRSGYYRGQIRLRGAKGPVPVELVSSVSRAADGREQTTTILRDISLEKQGQDARAEHATKMQKLARVALAINSAVSVDHVLAVVTERARELIPAHQAVTSLTVSDDWAQAISAVSLSDKYASWREYDEKPDASGIYRLVCELNRPLRLTQTELEAHPAFRGFGHSRDRHPPMRGWLAAPLTGRDGRNLGLIQLSDRYEGEFQAGDEAVLVQLAQIASIALENARLYEQTEQRRRTAESLARVEQAVSRSLDPKVVSRQVVESVCILLRAQSSALYQLDVESQDLTVADMAREAGMEFRWVERLARGTGVAGAAVSSRLPVFSVNVHTDGKIRYHPDVVAQLSQEDARAVLSVPLIVQERVLGALSVGDRAGRSFSREEIGLAQAFADQAAIALENARLFGEMLEAYAKLSRTREVLAQAQKMDAMGRLAGGVAHDFNNLLTVIMGHAELLKNRLTAEHPAVRHAELIQSTAERAVSLTGQLLTFSRKQVLRPQILDLNTVVADLTTMLRRLIGEDVTVQILLEASPALVMADAGQLEQVIVNLAVNARDAMPRGGVLTITTGNLVLDDPGCSSDLGAGAWVTLTVSDTGHGIDPEIRPHLFEPFFTTKPKSKGTGLGLATVYGIVTQSNGHIDAESEPGRGATFRIRLPLAEAGAPSMTATTRHHARGGEETILLVEDEDEVRALAKEVLEKAGYTVLSAHHADEALALAERQAGPIHLMVTDVVMPGTSGPGLAESLVPLRREMKVLYVSGYIDDAIVRHGVGEESFAFLQKPFAPALLVRTVREVLDAP
jgi:PAS domain S-box-containing protein